MGQPDEFLAEFVAEATDILDKAIETNSRIHRSENKIELLDEMSRFIHTVKGSSTMFGFVQTKDILHELESKLIDWRKKPETIKPEDIAFVHDELQKVIHLIHSKEKSSSSQIETNEEYVRVPVKRLNETLNAISEIFLVRNQMVYLIEKFKTKQHDPKDFLQNWELLDTALRRGIGDAERSTMSMRMMPVQGLFYKMERVVNDYKSKFNKKIRLQTLGENTELDKKVLDVLGEPLIHLIRNAMDHGIEFPEERMKNEKNEEGVITLSASIAGNEAVIKITDDGRGIDSQKVLASAKKKGLDVSHVTDESSALDLIFMPGFSTAESVSEISGRGIGMDAVRSSVQSLGGRVVTQTKVGQGTTFTIRLPVSMSLIPAVLTEVNGLKYAIANHEILETKRISPQELKYNANEIYVHFRDQFIPCIDLRNYLNTHASQEDLNPENDDQNCSIVIFSIHSKFVAARVDYFEKNMEIVVKPVPKFSPRLPYVTGVSVLPTGEPIFVLSVIGFYQNFFELIKERGLIHEAA